METPRNRTADSVEVDDEALRQFFGYHIMRASNRVHADLTRTLKPFDLRILSYSALVLVAGNPGLNQAQLADALGIERPNLVQIVDALEARDLIVRGRVPNDRRAYALSVTPAGKRLCEAASRACAGHEARLFGTIGEAERDGVIGVLSSIGVQYDD